MVRQLSDASDTILRSKVRSRHGQLFPKEYRPDTVTRKAGLLERVTDDLSPQGGNLGDCLVSWLDIIGECEKACGQIAVLLKIVPREPRDYLVLDSPHLLNVKASSLRCRSLTSTGIAHGRPVLLNNHQWKLLR